jgi:peptidase C39-like protein
MPAARVSDDVHAAAAGPAGQALRSGVPYVAQFASRELIDPMIHGRLPRAEDPLWASSGAATPEEYALWSDNMCGMACLAMILLAEGAHVRSLIDLARRCVAYGGYKVDADQIEGLYYAPFLAFVRAEFGLAGRIADPLSLEDIDRALEAGQWVIASVGGAIRYGQPSAEKRGGHLVLVLGHDRDAHTLWLHNPSGHTADSQAYAKLACAVFEAHFAHRGMLLNPNPA